MIQNRAGIKKIKVKNLINNYYFTNIKKEGFLQDKKYIVMNGNHRFIALKELYGEDYEIDCYIM